MLAPTYYVGIDIASQTFTSAIGREERDKWRIVVKPAKFENEYDSLPKYLAWLRDKGITQENVIFIMEATGVYNEVLAHFLVANGYTVTIEPPLKVRRAFKPAASKSDPVDSCQIAEYGYRFYDQLSIWLPRREVIEQIKVLLTVREQLVSDSTGHKNAFLALKRKVVRTPLAEAIHEKTILELKTHIKKVEDEIERLIDKDPDLRNMVGLLLSVPGVGLMLAAQMLILFQTSPRAFSPKKLAAYIGVCPYEDSSGSSRHNPSTSRHYGPSGLRRLLFLAALSLRTHHKQFQLYFYRKNQEGKPKRLIINNIINKLLKIMCAVVRTNTPYIDGYRSVHPSFFLQTLTMS